MRELHTGLNPSEIQHGWPVEIVVPPCGVIDGHVKDGVPGFCLIVLDSFRESFATLGVTAQAIEVLGSHAYVRLVDEKPTSLSVHGHKGAYELAVVVKHLR